MSSNHEIFHLTLPMVHVQIVMALEVSDPLMLMQLSKIHGYRLQKAFLVAFLRAQIIILRSSMLFVILWVPLPQLHIKIYQIRVSMRCSMG